MLFTVLRSFFSTREVNSYLSRHDKSLELSRRTESMLCDCFSESLETSIELLKKFEYSSSFSGKIITLVKQENSKNNLKKDNHTLSPSSSGNLNTHQLVYKHEVAFSKILLENAIPLLSDLTRVKPILKVEKEGKKTENYLQGMKKSLYFWKNNPENNEKYLRKELFVNRNEQKFMENRNLLGLSETNEWIENFNIGNIMHLNPMSYKEFTFYGEFHYEISNKKLLEMVFINKKDTFTVNLFFYYCNRTQILRIRYWKE